ncbi:MAG: HAMP domain-containing protein [Rubrivivax sp.]|nr:HAMP domain-containing protein [Rubrivivax sp.]
MSRPEATRGVAEPGAAVRGWGALRRLDTLALRLFVLMWVTLVLSHAVAFAVVTGMPGALFVAGEGEPARMRDRPPEGPRGPDGPLPRAPDSAPPWPPGDGPPRARGEMPGRLPLPTLGSLPPTPGVPQVAAARDSSPALPAGALALDYGVRMLVIALAAWWGARWLAQPMAHLVSAAQVLGSGLAHGRAPPPLDEASGTHEVRAVATVFNRMAAQIRKLFESRGLMMASISHDLRTPLTRMRMRVETADLPGALRERCVADLAEMNSLIDAVLDIFRFGAGTTRALQRVDITALLQALVDDHAEQGRSVRATMPEQALVAWTDALSLRRIVDNLVVNAVRYAGNAEVALTRGPEYLRISVEDRGPGIEPGRLADVLEPFVRLESSRSRDTGGAGLGLAIAFDLAQGLGGTLSLHNRQGGGLSAQVLLPWADARP